MMFLLVMDVVGSIAQAESAVKGVTFDGGCNLMKRPFQLYVAWVLSLIYETLLVVVTIWGSYKSAARRLGKQSIVYIIIRDGIWAYAAIFTILLINLAVATTTFGPFGGMFYHWLIAIVSSVGSHVILNLRVSGSRVLGIGDTTLGTSLPDPEFAAGGIHDPQAVQLRRLRNQGSYRSHERFRIRV
ncbi:hypothetical protein NLI96_g9446 [Meripilus lineatus]|uniref:Uncharacterized protein n=1 Tax=Meripilus lineatus TaxID=2056292 RepID=A0AAD5UVL3_9APHY|nr:hypothetical protein NLI96_g9446 [Physisporinus lineatus]